MRRPIPITNKSGVIEVDIGFVETIFMQEIIEENKKKILKIFFILLNIEQGINVKLYNIFVYINYFMYLCH